MSKKDKKLSLFVIDYKDDIINIVNAIRKNKINKDEFLIHSKTNIWGEHPDDLIQIIGHVLHRKVYHLGKNKKAEYEIVFKTKYKTKIKEQDYTYKEQIMKSNPNRIIHNDEITLFKQIALKENKNKNYTKLFEQIPIKIE